ncbi:MAG: T9SS type A sorting domain-containing protein [Bacteroidia bacterium]|nr:T9SS type A sorting domain-containing protein [Bacteroidia bacterium]
MSGQVVPIPGTASWMNSGNNIFQIGLPAYSSTIPVIIMVSAATPTAVGYGAKANLDYSTYYGGQGTEYFNDLKVAANGDRYVTGSTSNGVFPAFNSYNYYNGGTDIILLKYTADDTLRYATFQGGMDYDEGLTVAVDSKNDVFIGGQTFSTDMLGLNFPGATNQYTNGGTYFNNNKADGFLAKLTSNNNNLVWRRYVGGIRAESIKSIFIDNNDNLYFTGYSSSNNFPVVNAWKPTLSPPVGSNTVNFDAVFGKFNSNLVAQWITYYGGSTNGSTGVMTQDWGLDITVDNSGLVIGCGVTDATDFPVMNWTYNNNVFYQSTINGASDGFLVRFSSSGTPDYSTYFGGPGGDEITRLCFKSNLNELYFAGNTYNGPQYSGPGLPLVNKTGAFNSNYNGLTGYTAFLGYTYGNLTKLWCTKYGHGQSNVKGYSVNGLSVDDDGLVYLSGYTQSDTLTYPANPAITNVYNDSLRTFEDGFIAIFSADKSLYHAHYFGGSDNDRISNSDIAFNQSLYVTGITASNDFPIAYNSITAALIDSTFAGSKDGFISRFDLYRYQVTDIKTFYHDNVALKVFPNPANTEFTIQLEKVLASGSKVSVYSVLGQLIYENDLTGKDMKINCENWPNGVYLVKLGNNQTVSSFKLIKQQ